MSKSITPAYLQYNSPLAQRSLVSDGSFAMSHNLDDRRERYVHEPVQPAIHPKAQSILAKYEAFKKAKNNGQ